VPSDDPQRPFHAVQPNRRLVEEADDNVKPVVLGAADVTADRQRLPARLRHQLPAEAHKVVVTVRPVEQAEDVAGSLSLDAADPLGNLALPGEVGQWVDVAPAVRPDRCDRCPCGLQRPARSKRRCSGRQLLLRPCLPPWPRLPDERAAAGTPSMTSEVMRSPEDAHYDRERDRTYEPPAVGELLRDWRKHRRLSQFELALAAGVSSRHLSFVETGRSRPSADMVLHLAEHLDVPLRERNQLLLAAGYAPVFGQRVLDAPELGPVREAIDQLLRGHEPYPALVVDGRWGLVAANTPLQRLTAGVAEHLLQPPVNVLRLSLHPEGVAPRIVNLQQWRRHLLERLAREALATGDPALRALHEELAAYPVPAGSDELESWCTDCERLA
jgi:transcriptional regulator with XRE-family HTH domain